MRRIVVSPTGANKRDYNAWAGFRAARLPPVPDADVPRLVAPFLRHILEVYASDNVQTSEFIIDMFANCIKRPHMPSCVAINFFGRQGAGKGIILSAMRKYVIGREASFQTSTPELDLAGRFATGTFGKVFVQVDEVASLHQYQEIIKNLVCCAAAAVDAVRAR